GTRWADRRTKVVTNAGLRDLVLARPAELEALVLGGAKIDEQGLESLRLLKSFKSLTLNRTEASDAWVKMLSGMPRLERLSFRQNMFRSRPLTIPPDPRITNASAESLASMTQLKRLDLDGTGITDEGIGRLAVLTGLEHLSLADTSISDAALEHVGRLS